MNVEAPLNDLNITDKNYNYVYLASAIYGTITVCGVLSVTVFLAVLIKGYNTFKEYPFFDLVWMLTLCNLIHVYTQATCIFPLMFISVEDNTPQATWYSVGRKSILFTDAGCTLFIFLMAINRFGVFVFPKMLCAFSRENIRYPICVTWILIIILTGLKVNFGPEQKFSKDEWELKDLFFPTNSIIYTAVTWIDFIVPGVVLLFYVTIYIKIRSKRSGSAVDSNNTEHILLTQGMLIALSLALFRMLANIAPALDAKTWIRWVLNITRSVASILNNMLNPMLFLTTNRTVMKTLANLIRCRSGNPITVSESDAAKAPKFRRKLHLGLSMRNSSKNETQQLPSPQLEMNDINGNLATPVA